MKKAILEDMVKLGKEAGLKTFEQVSTSKSFLSQGPAIADKMYGKS